MNHHLSPFAFGRRFFVTALALSLAGCLFSAERPGRDDDRDANAEDPVVLRFSTVGDSRQDPAKPDPTTLPLSGQDAIWLQNTEAFSRIMRSIQSEGSQFLFFNGDMIMGYGKAGLPADVTTVDGIVNSDLMQFYRQYAFWRGLVAPLMETGTYVVPVPGNHEVQSKALGKKAQVENEKAWRANMSDLILDDARLSDLLGAPATAAAVGDNRSAADGLTTDQSKLSYSFDFQGSHFVVINTDPVGRDAHAPVAWLAGDLAAAKARGAQHVFVFGHKPAFTYYYAAGLPAAPSGLDNDLVSRDAFWDLIETYGATYFCGHEHIFNLTQPRLATGGKAWQVLVGSGGSPFDATPTDVTVNPATDRTYAWATVSIHRSGKVRIKALGFSDQFGPTHLLESVTVH